MKAPLGPAAVRGFRLEVVVNQNQPQRGFGMTMRALVSADRPVVRIWHLDNPKVYVEIQFESRDAANTAVEQLNGMLKYATGLEFGEDAPS